MLLDGMKETDDNYKLKMNLVKQRCYFRDSTYNIKHSAKQNILIIYTARKIKFSIKDFFSKCDNIRSVLRIWPHLLKKPLMENLIFCAVIH